jgi:two-component system KDP operon response regulator KdpE
MNSEDLSKPLVLVIEDEKSILESISGAIGDRGMRVIQATNGVDGLTSAIGRRPDLILLDLGLPKMDGLTLFSKLREDEWGKTAKVIIFSATDPDGRILESINELRPAYYLVKSNWSLDDVVQRIEELVREPSSF